MAAIDRGEGVVDDLAGDQQVHPVLARLETAGSLGSRVRTGIAWTGTFRVIMQVLNTGSQVVLARLLLPTDYGLVALTGVFMAFAAMLTQLGLAAAVVQSRRVTERLLSTAFWLNVISGIVVTGVLVAAAPLVADFYGDERVTNLLRVSSLSFTLSCAAVHSALLQRSLQFKRLGSLEVLGAVIGLGATIVLAWQGFGAYSLVLGPLLQTTLMTGVFWWRVRWLPRTFMHRRELGELWRFGAGLTGSNILNFVARNADTVLLGRFAGAADLGLYSRSYSLMMAPLTQVTGVITRVLLPAFAEMQHDLPRLRRAWLMTIRASLALGLPASLGIAVSAPAFVETLYGARWLGMATVLALLSASVPPQLIGRNLGPVYQAMGRTGLQFKDHLHRHHRHPGHHPHRPALGDRGRRARSADQDLDHVLGLLAARDEAHRAHLAPAVALRAHPAPRRRRDGGPRAHRPPDRGRAVVGRPHRTGRRRCGGLPRFPEGAGPRSLQGRGRPRAQAVRPSHQTSRSGHALFTRGTPAVEE